MATIEFIVYGKPQQRGSKQANVRYDRVGNPVSKGGRVLTFAKDDNPRSKEWMQMVTSAAADVMQGRALLAGPIRLTAVFWFARPLSHFGTGRNASVLKSTAPQDHIQKPDLSKLMRSLEDALTGVVWRDDCQVCYYGDGTGKAWTTTQACAAVTIEQLEDA